MTSPPPPDPHQLAPLHALRVHLVLHTPSAAGATPDRRTAERHVHDQRSAAVLLGATSENPPDKLAEVGQLLDEVARTTDAVPATRRSSFPAGPAST